MSASVSSSSSSLGNETCARLAIGSPSSLLFVKGTWFPTHFFLSISDGLHAWSCNATQQAVADRAAGWDESVTEYIQRAQFYLSHQHPESSYAFMPDGDNRKLSWTMEKHGTKLEGKWKCEKARNEQQTICEILNFLMDSNVKISDEVLRKTQSFERMKIEAEKCLKQSEQFKNEKQQFEMEMFKKFVAVLNSKKAKLRELRDKLLRLEPASGSGEDRGNELEDETDNEEDEGNEDETNAAESDSMNDKPPSKSEILQANDSELPEVITREDTSISIQKPSKEQVATGANEVQARSKLPAESGGAIDSAAALFAESTYTSAPKRRRHF